MNKFCKNCATEKDKSLFSKNKRYKDGHDYLCKDCRNEINKNYRADNQSNMKTARKKHYQINIVKMRREKRAYYAKNREKKSAYDVVYRKNNVEKIRVHKRKWEHRNKNIIHVRIKRNLRRRLSHVISRKNKSASTLELLGCGIEKFISHIENQFEIGMSWENYGRTGWHIDHKRPCFKFDLTKASEQRKCFHYSNLRPLWWKENISRRRNI